MSHSILIECPREVQAEIEEICLNRNISFTQYFLDLHNNSKNQQFFETEPEPEEKFERKKGKK